MPIYKRLVEPKEPTTLSDRMSKPCVIYCMKGNDGSFYYGSTSKTINKRFSDHKCRAKHMTEMKVYKHFNALGWENVQVEEIEQFEADRKGQIAHENKYILPNINNEKCLNSHCSLLTPEEKISHRHKAQKKHDDANREKRKQKCRNHYYKLTYGMTEEEYKIG